MKSLQKSDGKKFLSFGRATEVLLVFSLGATLAACAVTTRHDQEPKVAPTAEAGDGGSTNAEVSLAGDRGSVEELRKNIPPAKREANDDLRAVLSLFGEVKVPPEKIRDRYQRIIQREREKFRRDNQREREAYDRDEKKRRDEFNNKIKAEREDFNPKRYSNDDRKKFYDDLEQKRRDFNADEHTKRDDFNASVKEKSDDFNSQMRDRDQEFNEQYRAYTLRYNDWQKEIKNKASGQSNGAINVPKVHPRPPGEEGNSMFAPQSGADGNE